MTDELMSDNILKNIDKKRIPTHIAIIMDGNGRWAKNKNMPRVFGHRAGVDAIREIVKASSEIGLKYLTLYAFSTENWKRPKEEVNALMSILVEYLKKEVDELHKNQVVVRTIGNIEDFPEKCRIEISKAYEKTKSNSGLNLVLALNYGARTEIIRAVKKIAKMAGENEISIDSIDDNIISKNLYTKDIPDPDLLIRTSGELRISNFLLWQVAYSELYFTDKYWPDFKKNDLYDAIKNYQKRDRRFGGI